MRNAREKTRSGITPSPAGLSYLGSGLEIKERLTEREKKDALGLRGFYVDNRGFYQSPSAAEAARDVQQLLERLKAKQAAMLHF